MSKKNLIKKKLDYLFQKLKICKGDNVLIHSNSAGILQFENKKDNLNSLFTTLKKKVGTKGTIVIPTYNWSILKKKIVNWKEMPSEVGLLSNILLRSGKFSRTRNPVYSHIVNGNLKKDLLNSNNQVAFKNDNNFFQKIIDYKFKILGFCCPLNKMTLLHYIECLSNVPYRFEKKFYIKEKNKNKLILYKYFVGKKKIDYKLKDKNIRNLLINKKKVKFVNFGKFESWIVNSDKVNYEVLKKFKKNKFFLISK